MIAFISAFSTVAFSQSVVTDPVGVKQKVPRGPLQIKSTASAHPMLKTSRPTSTSRTAKRPVVARMPVKGTK